ncbi:MAG: circadian clock protein KaiC [Actinomycetota bacterium]|nr:circadian clock protein KaiC [Actinomycetota bacterium]
MTQDGSDARVAQQAGDLAVGEDGHQHGGSIPKLETGIAGFDDMTMGGIPRRRATVLAGQAGSAKTVFSGQFLAEGVRRGQPGVFVTLEEPADDLRENLSTLGCDIAGWERAGDWRFVDASPLMRLGPDGQARVEPYRIETLVAQIGHAVDATGAQRLVLDSLNAMLALQDDPRIARQALRSLIGSLRGLGLTVMLTVETPADPGTALSSYGIEEFVADNVVLLHNVLEGRVRRRTVEVLKMRGAMHHRGEVPFTVLPGQGVVVLPMTRQHVETPDPTRVTSGDPAFDEMLRGGFFTASVALIAGPTGTGKSMLATQFLGGACENGERALLFAFEESRGQVLRSAAGWGRDFAGWERDGLLHIAASYPDVASLDDHLVQIQEVVRRFRPARVAVDSLSALERLGTNESYREFVTRLTAFLKQEQVLTMVTVSSSALLGGTSVAEGHISPLTDAIVLLRYAEVAGSVRRAVAVIKLRGSGHDERIRQFTIGSQGLELAGAFDTVTGILSGHPVPFLDGRSSAASR